MIHQLIFAAPKPGMSEQAFQDYWINVHAVQYASKIPQIRQYSIAARVPLGPESEEPLWSGVAEIWLENEAEQLASLQSKAFLEGARVDEPRWAAYWRTVVLDTDAHVLKDGGGLDANRGGVKLIALVKRRWGMSLDDFRRYSLDVHGPLDLRLPGLRRYVQCHVRDGSYVVGESMFDGVALLWFDDVDALKVALDSPENAAAAADLDAFVEQKYAHVMVTREHWVIGPHGYD